MPLNKAEPCQLWSGPAHNDRTHGIQYHHIAVRTSMRWHKRTRVMVLHGHSISDKYRRAGDVGQRELRRVLALAVDGSLLRGQQLEVVRGVLVRLRDIGAVRRTCLDEGVVERLQVRLADAEGGCKRARERENERAQHRFSCLDAS